MRILLTISTRSPEHIFRWAGVVGRGHFGTAVLPTAAAPPERRRGMWRHVPIAAQLFVTEYPEWEKCVSCLTSSFNISPHLLMFVLVLFCCFLFMFLYFFPLISCCSVSSFCFCFRLRSEMAILSRIRHPHIVLFLGATPHMCLGRGGSLLVITESMPNGSLRECLASPTQKAEWANIGWRRCIPPDEGGHPPSATAGACGVDDQCAQRAGLCTQMMMQLCRCVCICCVFFCLFVVCCFVDSRSSLSDSSSSPPQRGALPPRMRFRARRYFLRQRTSRLHAED